MGSSSTNTLPCPSSLRTVKSPLCARAIARLRGLESWIEGSGLGLALFTLVGFWVAHISVQWIPWALAVCALMGIAANLVAAPRPARFPGPAPPAGPCAAARGAAGRSR